LKSTGYLAPAWLGLVPCQYSSGGKTRLGRITKAGDEYLRSLLVMGAFGITDLRRDWMQERPGLCCLERWADRYRCLRAMTSR
jgi:hypothetical protein